MKVFIKIFLHSTILILGIILPFVAFAQSWEPENVWRDSSIEVETIPNGERCAPLTIRVKFFDDISINDTSINHVFIHYSAQNHNYTRLPMEPSTQEPNIFITTLPPNATQWYYIDYYIEVFNAQNKLVTSTGNAINPTRIFLTGECSEQITNPSKVNQPSNEGDSLNDDIYDEIFAKKTPSASGNTTRSQASSSSKTTTQPKTTDTKQTPPKYSNALQTTNELLNQPAQSQNTPNTHLSSSDDILSYPSFQFSVMLGTGVGIVGDKTENCDGNAKCMPNGGSVSSIGTGVASLPLHLRASAMFNLPKHFQIGAYLRGQLISIVKDTLTPNAKANVKNPEQYNIMVGLTARYLILWEQPYRLYVGLELGWGGANATVDMGRNFNNFKDIYLYKGPWHIAPEIGFLWNFHKNVGLAVELTIPIVFPERPSAFFDLSIGPYIQL